MLCNDPDVQSLMEEFESGRNMFDGLDTTYKMNKYFSENLSLVKPKEVFLGYRSDTERKQGVLKQALIADTFQYISIIDTLRFLFKNEQMQELCCQTNNSSDAKMSCGGEGKVKPTKEYK